MRSTKGVLNCIAFSKHACLEKAMQFNSSPTTGVHTHFVLHHLSPAQCHHMYENISVHSQIISALFRWLKLIVSANTIQGNTVIVIGQKCKIIFTCNPVNLFV